jgi:UDP-glucose 4-epimerase
MNVLVAGGAGFIGSHLVDKLIERGDYVVVADNLCLGEKELIAHHFDNPKFKFCEIDIADNIKLNKTFEQDKFDRVYHLAANSDIQKGGKNPDIDIHDTFETTLSVLQSMRKFGVKEMIFSSTSAVYGDKTESLTETTGGLNPISYYGGAKLASEAFISAFAAMCDMRANIIRFPNVVGERLTHGAIYDFIKKLKTNQEELEILGDGNQEKPYIYVGDLVAAMLYLPFGDVGVNVFNAGVDSS